MACESYLNKAVAYTLGTLTFPSLWIWPTETMKNLNWKNNKARLMGERDLLTA